MIGVFRRFLRQRTRDEERVCLDRNQKPERDGGAQPDDDLRYPASISFRLPAR